LTASQIPAYTVPWLQGAQQESNQTTENNGILGKDDFLKLLVAELKYQDPMEPMKDREFISQMANFSSLEQMKNLNTGFENLSTTLNTQLMPLMTLQQASAMIGRQVSYLGAVNEEGERQQLVGTIEAVVLKDGRPWYVIDGIKIDSANVLEMGAVYSDAMLAEILGKLDQLLGLLAVDKEGADDDQ